MAAIMPPSRQLSVSGSSGRSKKPTAVQITPPTVTGSPATIHMANAGITTSAS